MKKSTKILSLILSVLTLLSVFSVATPVFAAEVTSESAETIDDMTISSEETEETEQAEIVSEIEDMRTEYTKYFRMSDGSYIAAQYTQPVHFKENGQWKEYDYSIVENKDADETEKFVLENSDNKMTFPKEFEADDSAQIKISEKGYEIKFAPVVEKRIFKSHKAEVTEVQKLKSNEMVKAYSKATDATTDKNDEKLKIDNQKSAIVYEDVYSNVDFEYEISSNQIKESIVLNSKQDKNTFEFTFDTDGLFPKKETDGSITLYEDKEYKKPVSCIAAPYMFDAEEAVSYDVTMDIKAKNSIYILTIKASDSWLNSKERKYPVVIDPTILLDVGRLNTVDCYVINNQASSAFPTDYYLYAGHSTLGKARTYVKFTLPELPDNCSIITNACIMFSQKSADVSSTEGYLNLYNVTSAWENNGTVTWNNKPTADENLVLDYAKIVPGTNVQYNFDITKTVKAWYEGATNNGLMLASANESVVNRVQLYSAENNGTNTYPHIVVTYRNNKGLEEHWSYSSYANDTAGAAYINDYTGNLVYALPILSSESEIMPLTLTAFFNNYCANVKYCAGVDGSSKTTPGKGFRLNIQQTILPSSEYGLTGDSATTYPYVYTDGDGTEHYIQKVTEDGKTVYKDEDGLGLTLIVGENTSYKYRLNDKNDNLWYFNNQGNLYCQKDSNGNQLGIYFKTDTTNDLANKMIDYVVDGAGHKFSFNYYKNSAGVPNGYIETITDSAGRVVAFTTTSGLLRQITYPDGTFTEIKYEGDESEGLINYIQSFNGYGLNFDYTSKATGRQVKKVKEIGKNSSGVDVLGQIITFDRSAYNTTVIRSAGIDGVHGSVVAANGADDIVTTLQFDNEGKTVSQQVSYGSGAEVGAGSYKYASGASTLGSANKITSSASLGKNTVNLISEGNAETNTNWSFTANSGVTATNGFSTNNHYTGKKSLYITNNSFSNNGVSYYRQTVNLNTSDEEKAFTFSAYVKAATLTKYASTNGNAGVYLQITPYNSNNTALSGTVYSEKITAKTDTAINNGWRRITVTLPQVPKNTAKLSVYLCLRDYKGTVCFDSIQLEKGSAANSYNLLENGSFEKVSSNKPNAWSNAGDFTIATSGSTVIDGASDKARKEGTYSLRIDGDALKSKGMGQTVAVAPNENDTYIVSGWASANAVNDTCHLTSANKPKTKFEIFVRVNYTCTDSSGNTTNVYQDKDPAVFNTTISGWQYASSAFSLKYTNPASGKTYTPQSVLILPRYCYQENHAFFDHIQLIKDEGQTHTYTYDKDGNVVLSAVNSEQKVNTKYNDKNDLTEYTDMAGYKTTATYDDNHNLLTTTSEKGFITQNSYAANGNLTSVVIKNNGNTEAIKSSEITYNTAKNEGGFTIKAGAHVTEQKNSNNVSTLYSRDHKTGALLSVSTKDNATETTLSTRNYSYNDAKFSRLLSITQDGTQINYNYVSGANGILTNQISEITFTGTGTSPKSEIFKFEYDSYGNVTKTFVGNKALSTKTYGDNNGILQSEAYGNDDKRNYSYNNLGLVSSITSVNNGTSKTSYSWGYNSVGTLLYHRDAENNLKYLYDYDSLGRVIRQKIQTNDTFAHVGSTELTYDVRNNVTKVSSEFGGYTATDEYMFSSNSGAANAANYAKDNLISRYRINNSVNVDYLYDDLNRLTQKKLCTTRPVYTNYTYAASAYGGNYTTTRLDSEKLDNTTYQYYYDSVGNITGIDKAGAAYRRYTYDNKNQLLSEANSSNGVTTTFTYDELGNILTKTLSGTENKTITYNYGKDDDAGWNHILTSITTTLPGETPTTQTIDYDEIGNPTTYLGASLDWYGRQLKSYNKGATSVTYTYDEGGIRGTKKVNGIKSTYHYVGGQLRYEERGNTAFYYFYDASGNLSAIRYVDSSNNVYQYYALTNAQGDVIAFYNAAGNCVVTYEYDAWGNCTIVSDTPGVNIGELNPIRYRGYYYDTETGLYYLQSRYYDPQVGRFLNADLQISGVGGAVLGNNVFAYCFNNPVNSCDFYGCWPQWVENAADWFENNVVQPVVNFFNPNTNKIETCFQNGSLYASSSFTAGYTEMMIRGQGDNKVSSENGSASAVFGVFAKASILNTKNELGIGNESATLSLKGVGDVFTASSHAGLQYKYGLGLTAKAKAAVFSGRATIEFQLNGWEFEFGLTGDAFAIGAEATIGIFDNAFEAKANASCGVGGGFVFRAKPA